jgi:opacity protein-like surface antigen
MLKRAWVLTLACAVLAVTAASAQDVRYNFDQSADFSKYKTYKWVQLKGGEQVDDLISKQIVEALEAGLAAKGLTKTDADTADLYIGYQVAIHTEKEFTSYSTDWGYGPGWRGGWYGGMGSTTTTGQTTTIYIGELALDMYDAAQKNLVWRGVVSKTLDPKAKPEKRQKNLNKAVTKLLKKYPPEKKS